MRLPPGLPDRPRILIVGGARTGKTTLAEKLRRDYGIPTRCTDDLIHGHGLDWSGVSARVAHEWLAQPGPWCIEGTRTAHALRKWVKNNPGQKPPVDLVVLLWRPYLRLDEGQRRQAEGVATVWRGIEPVVRRRRVRVVEG